MFAFLDKKNFPFNFAHFCTALMKMQNSIAVVYFDQQTCAPHAVRWSKSIFLTLNQLFPSLTEKKKAAKNMQKHAFTNGSF